MRASVWSAAGAATVGAGAAALAVVDRAGGGWTARDVTAHYGPFGRVPDPDVLTAVLVVATTAFTAWMVGVAMLARRGHDRVATCGAALGACAWAALAVVGVGAHEFGGPVLLPGWRAALAVLPVLALVVAAMLGTDSRRSGRSEERR